MSTPPLPRTRCAPKLWLWPGRALYAGPSLGLDPHTGSVSCLAAAVDGRLTADTGEGPGPAVGTAFIPPRLKHRIVSTAERMVFCYLDAGSRREGTCRAAMGGADGAILQRRSPP